MGVIFLRQIATSCDQTYKLSFPLLPPGGATDLQKNAGVSVHVGPRVLHLAGVDQNRGHHLVQLTDQLQRPHEVKVTGTYQQHAGKIATIVYRQRLIPVQVWGQK